MPDWLVLLGSIKKITELPDSQDCTSNVSRVELCKQSADAHPGQRTVQPESSLPVSMEGDSDAQLVLTVPSGDSARGSLCHDQLYPCM